MLGLNKHQIREIYIMKNSALVVIDLQNDITKNYREIIEKVNKAIDWAVEKGMWVIYIQHNNITTCLPGQEHSSRAHMARSWCRR